ncbi:NAD(P)-binding protein [Obba rivulosa]|uniref:NAD(P)-binding protein n=1 Tax=Obba rivulosa TaxID=1052685 RepID=A0A8E2DDP9_9APHY|nr:NAD(P)-binding protein [Obba rivulosa]
MKLAITGCNGSIGQRVVIAALRSGHDVVGIDLVPLKDYEYVSNPKFNFRQIDVRDYEAVLHVLEGCEAIIHLAGIRSPEDYIVKTHNTNVVMSWNVLRAAAELGIKRVAQASSVNVISLVYSVKPIFDYLPLDEDHPCRPDEPYGLSKIIAETQAETIVRRYPFMRVASLRLSWSLPRRSDAARHDPARRKNDLWGYVQEDAGADAFLLAVTNEDEKWSGHEAFIIAAPDTSDDRDSMFLKEQFWANVPIKGGKDLSGRKSFFDCSKAERLLGWAHRSSEV